MPFKEYHVTETERQRVNNEFTYHAPFGDQQERYEALRASSKYLAELILSACPTSRERSVALTKLKEVAMWANASIACNETPGARGQSTPPQPG